MATLLPRDAGEAALAWISEVIDDVGILHGNLSPDFASSGTAKKSTWAVGRSKRSDGMLILP